MIDPNKDFDNYQLIVTQVINAFSESPSVQAENTRYLQFKKKLIDDNPLNNSTRESMTWKYVTGTTDQDPGNNNFNFDMGIF